MKVTSIATLLLLAATLTHADGESILEKHIGWTIVATKTIEGYRDLRKEKKDDFEGCDFDRVVFFKDGTTVTCNSYGYQYAYKPKAIILGKPVTYKGQNLTIFKMVVNGNEYDVN